MLAVTSAALMMRTETIPEMSASFSLLTRLIAREDFINFSFANIKGSLLINNNLSLEHEQLE
jgi:hypothetical protein